jgi:ribosome-associated translation inhibitor RaiA
MNSQSDRIEVFEISPRFRQSLEDRIGRLERDADDDEAMLANLISEDHIQRHRRLVTVQRTEALRMRVFLDRSRPRLPRPLIAL